MGLSVLCFRRGDCRKLRSKTSIVKWELYQSNPSRPFYRFGENTIPTAQTAQTGVNHSTCSTFLFFLAQHRTASPFLKGTFFVPSKYCIKKCDCGFVYISCGAAAKYRPTVPTGGVLGMRLPHIFKAGAYKFLKSTSSVKLFMLVCSNGECALWATQQGLQFCHRGCPPPPHQCWNAEYNGMYIFIWYFVFHQIFFRPWWKILQDDNCNK